MDYILSFREPRKRLAAVHSAPKDLSSAYNEIISRIESGPPGDKDLAMRILSWVLRSLRPLEMDELREALVVEDAEPDITLEELLQDRLSSSDIIECCKSLVIHEDSSGLVRFTHFTAYQFVADHASSRLPPTSHLANSCLTYFSCHALMRPKEHSDTLMRLKGRSPFFVYAIEHWAQHTAGDAEDLPSIQRKFLLAFGSSQAHSTIISVLSQYRNLPIRQRGVLLHVIARFGLAKLCRLYLNGELNSMFLSRSSNGANT
jgi:hypothetical protein